SMDAGYDLDGETVCARIGDLRYPRNRNQSQQHYCQENFSAHLDFSSEAVYLGKRCHWLLAVGFWAEQNQNQHLPRRPTTAGLQHGGTETHGEKIGENKVKSKTKPENSRERRDFTTKRAIGN